MLTAVAATLTHCGGRISAPVYIIEKVKTGNSMELGPSWEAAGCAAIQEFPKNIL
jgi:phage baseplate assembly protein gpV